jgi:hypothetical protein
VTEPYGNVKTPNLWKLRFFIKKKKKEEVFFLVFGSVENTERALGFLGICREGQLAKRERTQM